MKKHYLIGALIAATGIFAATANLSGRSFKAPNANSEPFTVPVTLKPVVNEVLQEGWDVLDNNHDEVQWAVYGNQARLNYSAKDMTQDDYLFSPTVSLEAGVSYTFVINYEMGNSNFTENLSVYVSTSKEPTEVKQEKNKIFSRTDSYASANTVVTQSFNVEADGDYHFAFYCDSPGDRYYVYLNEFSVLGEVKPNPVSSLRATAAADKSVSCTLTWTLPTTNNAGGALVSIEKVVVFRDDVQIKELDGSATSFTDTESDGLTAGEHTYAVMVVVDGEESEKAVTSKVSVGPLEPKSIPASFTFASENDFGNWVVIKGADSNNSYTWTYDSSINCASYKCDYTFWSSYTDDDWLIAPPVKVEEAGYFKVVVSGVKTATAVSNFELVMGSAPTTEMSVVGESFDLPYYSGTPDFASKATQTAIEIYLEPGTYYFGLHNRLGSNFSASNTYKIGGLSVETSQAYPGTVSNLTAQGATDFSKNITVSWSNPTVDQVGQPWGDKAYVVKVFVGDSETPVKTITDGATSCTIPVEDEGVYTIIVVTETPDGATSGKKVSVNSGWVGSPFVELPYTTAFDDNSDSKLDIWRANFVDGNADGKTFEIGKNYYDVTYLQTQQGAFKYEDYALSPYVALKASTYKVELDWSANGYSDITMVAGLIEAGSFDKDYVADASFVSTSTLTHGEDGTYSRTFVVPAAGNYQFVISHLGSNEYALDFLRITRFEIIEDVTYPADVTDLTVVSDPEDESKAIISWTNPSTCYESEDALESIEAIVVYRDGVLVGTVDDPAKLEPGAECSYTDELEEGGVYTYTVYATVNGRGRGGEYPSVKSSWIGGGLTSLDMEADDERWSFIDTHGDYDAVNHMYGWCMYTPYSIPYLYYHHNGEGANEADDYLTTPPVRIAEGSIYQVSIDVLPNQDADSKAFTASVKMGLGSDAEAWEHVHAITVAEDAANTTVIPHKFNVAVGTTPAHARRKVEGVGETEDPVKALYEGAVKLAAGSHTIAIHATTRGGMLITKLSFNKVAEYTPGTTGIDGVAAEDFAFDGHTVTFAGTADVTIYNLAGVCVHSESDCCGSFAVPALEPGVYFIKVNDRILKYVSR